MAPRTPTAVLDARGAFINHPERKRESEPQDDRPLGGPPKYLTKSQKKVWKELATQLMPGVGKFSDRTPFEMLVRLTDRLRQGLMTKSADMLALIQICGRFGMTPVDRSKIAVEAAPKSKLEQFLNRPKFQQPAIPEHPVPSNLPN